MRRGQLTVYEVIHRLRGEHPEVYKVVYVFDSQTTSPQYCFSVKVLGGVE
jgi:hypothetical protein